VRPWAAKQKAERVCTAPLGPKSFPQEFATFPGSRSCGQLFMPNFPVDFTLKSPLEAALDYLLYRELPVFPARLVFQPNGKAEKVPYVKWRYAETLSPRQVEDWWRHKPHALIATPAGQRSGLVLLDIDRKNGVNGFDTLESLGKASLPETPMAHSRSGGLHVYFRARDDIEIRNSEGERGLGVGLDVRGEGGLIILPTPGSGYTWDPVCNLDTCTPRLAPAWLGHRAQRDRPAGTGWAAHARPASRVAAWLESVTFLPVPFVACSPQQGFVRVRFGV